MKLILTITAACVSFPAIAQETLNLKQCRDMALTYNKEMAASVKQTESTRYTVKSYK